jgi:hypothetical protein
VLPKVRTTVDVIGAHLCKRWLTQQNHTLLMLLVLLRTRKAWNPRGRRHADLGVLQEQRRLQGSSMDALGDGSKTGSGRPTINSIDLPAQAFKMLGLLSEPS